MLFRLKGKMIESGQKKKGEFSYERASARHVCSWSVERSRSGQKPLAIKEPLVQNGHLTYTTTTCSKRNNSKSKK
jgi:hypothetical protein